MGREHIAAGPDGRVPWFSWRSKLIRKVMGRRLRLMLGTTGDKSVVYIVTLDYEVVAGIHSSADQMSALIEHAQAVKARQKLINE